jgi:hypothetical protein
MGSINLKSINLKIKKSKAFQREIISLAQDVFEDLKREAVKNFLEHPITMELNAGENAQNISNTLGGRGNLFSFIGFENGADPIAPVEALFKRLLSIKLRKINATSRNIRASFTVTHPEIKDFDNAARMPWSSKSWVRGVEDGISGFNYYLFKRAEASRSGTAIQVDGKIRSASFKRMGYITEVINNFRKNFK